MGLGALDGLEGFYKGVHCLGRAGDAGVLEHLGVGDHTDGAGRPGQPILLAAVFAQLEHARVDHLLQLCLAVNIVEVDHFSGRGKLRQPALSQLNYIQRLVGAQAQKNVLLHLSPGETNHIELDVSVGLAVTLKHRCQRGFAGGLVVRPANKGQAASLRLQCAAAQEGSSSQRLGKLSAI